MSNLIIFVKEFRRDFLANNLRENSVAFRHLGNQTRFQSTRFFTNTNKINVLGGEG
jgi:hypothetical protein